MVIQCISAQNKRDFRNAFVVVVNGKSFLNFVDGEPEDNSISRNFNDILNIGSLIERAIKARDSGESVEIKNEEMSWEDIFELD